jgi:thiamine-phosphate pyrophosphorylase
LRNAIKVNGVNRIIDANLNRAKEGLRVCEEICRFIAGERSLTAELTYKLAPLPALLKGRDSVGDVGRKLHHKKELQRRDFWDIYLANMQRLKESLRVLEEFSKLQSAPLAIGFKKVRYDVYALEKKATEKLLAVRHSR